MKGILKLIAFSLLVFMFGCDDYLEEYPISTYNTGDFFTTVEGLELGINGAYSSLKEIYGTYLPETVEARTSSYLAGANSTADYSYKVISQARDESTTPIFASMWQEYYKAIGRCNKVLAGIGDVDFIDENRKNNMIGEARFLRALFYFDLVRLFGGVPLIDKPYTAAEIKQIPRATVDDTYAFIINGLKKSITTLPTSWVGDNLGRADVYAAKGILARAYLTRNELGLAKNELQDIIDSGKYEMFENYSDVVSDINDNGKEFIFQVQFISGNVGEGNSFPYSTVPRSVTTNLETPYSPGGNQLSTQFLYDAFSSDDLRRDIILQKGIESASGGYVSTTVWGKKYIMQGNKSTSANDWEINLPVLRYADVWLMYAEILNEENYVADGEAFEIINKIRQRAGLPNLTSAEVTNQVDFRDALFEERRFEFVYENLRWFDLLRQGKAIETINKFFVAETAPTPNSNILEPHQLLFPIPEEELLRNPNRDIIWQNPGY